MEKSNKKNMAAAVIDIGSNVLRMQIGILDGDKIKIMEDLKYPLSLGRDTFTMGSIGFGKVDKTCDIINKFVLVAQGYGIDKVKAVATTAMREAANRDFIIDRIKIRTGVKVEVLDDSAEKTLIYKEITRRLMKTKQYKSQALMVYIGVGNLGVSIYDNGKIPFTQNIRIGSLRLTEMLFNMQEYEEQYSIVIEDYLRSFKNTFYNTMPDGDINHFVASGREMSIISHICKAENDDTFAYISREKFIKLYESLKNKTVDQIMDDYNVSEENAELLRSAMSIYNMLLKVTSADKIIAPIVFITDALLFDILKPKQSEVFNVEFQENTVLSARTVAQRYEYDENHSKYVEKYSLKIFDKLKKIHGMGAKERLYLQIASIMHDVGKYVNIRSHYNHSYEIVRSSDVVGLDMHDLELIANITKYHSTITPSMYDYSYNRLNADERMVISKLSAMLRISEALDKGHMKKFDDIDIKIKGNSLIIGISTLNNTQIEEWSFEKKKQFFEEVFGMKATIKKKKVI